MKYLVLGSSGQIGLSLVNFLRDQKHTVFTYDIVENPEHDLRITNSAYLDSLIRECDFIFHLAWDVGGSVYLAKYQDTYDFIANNLKITSNSFDIIKKYNKPFIFASSQMASMSHSSYGVTKSIAERLAASLNGITVKFWNVYGIEHDHEKTHVITDFINKAMDTGVIDMRTDGAESRQFLYADDCSMALYTLSIHYENLPRDKNYHITSFQWNTVLDVANCIALHFPGTKVQPANKKDTVQLDAKNEPDTYILEYWRPQTSLEDGIAQIVTHMTETK